MKRLIAVSIAAVSIFAAGAANAQATGEATTPPINMEEVTKFEQESAGLRGELIIKKLELIGESMKQSADPARAKAIAQEIVGLQAKIENIAKMHGLPGPANCQSVLGGFQTDLTEAELEALYYGS